MENSHVGCNLYKWHRMNELALNVFAGVQILAVVSLILMAPVLLIFISFSYIFY